MAAAAELFESGVGDVSADRDGFGATRLFHVTIDEVGENADDILRDVDKVGTDNAVPLGAPHPRRGGGLFAAFYSTERRLRNKDYIVRVIYAPPVDFTTSTNPWELSYQPGLTTVTVRHDWQNMPIGPASYQVFEDSQTLPGTEFFKVTVPSTIRKPAKVLTLVRTDSLTSDDPVKEPIRLHNADRTEPSGSFAMTKQFDGMHTDGMSALVMLSNIVNNKTFFGFPPRTVKFIGPVAQAGEGSNQRNTLGYVWRVTLAFEWNSLGYRWTAQDEFIVDNQRLPVIREDGTPMIRGWQLYPEGDLNVIPDIALRFGAFGNQQQLGIVDHPGRAPGPIQIPGGG